MYRIDTFGEARDQIAALPAAGLAGFLEILTVLELVPWNGAPYNKNLPDGAMRAMLFGPREEGLCVYLVDDDVRRVEILRVVWAG